MKTEVYEETGLTSRYLELTLAQARYLARWFRITEDAELIEMDSFEAGLGQAIAAWIQNEEARRTGVLTSKIEQTNPKETRRKRGKQG